MKPVIKDSGNLKEVIVVGLLAALIAAVFVGGVIAPEILEYYHDYSQGKGTNLCINISMACDSSLAKGTNGCVDTVVKNMTETVKNALLSEKSTPSSFERGSKVFEAYGRLITAVVSLMTVLGVFFVYFSRKSHRDLEEEVRTHLATEVEKIETIKTKAETKLQQVEQLKKDCEELFKALDNHYKLKDKSELGSRSSRSQDAAENVDAQLEKEGL